MFKEGDLIQFKDEPDRWGIVTCLSDDDSTVYYKPRGCGPFRSSAPIDKVEIPPKGKG